MMLKRFTPHELGLSNPEMARHPHRCPTSSLKALPSKYRQNLQKELWDLIAVPAFLLVTTLQRGRLVFLKSPACDWPRPLQYCWGTLSDYKTSPVPTPHDSMDYELQSEVNHSANVQGVSERSVTPLSADTRSTVWVSETRVGRQSLPYDAATVWTAERGDGGQESAQSANADATPLVAALQDDEEAPLGENRNATQTQQSTIISATPFECPDCDRAFRTKAGRTLHSKARHPVEANAEVVVERVKPQWEAEERYLLAKREVELRSAGSTFLNVDLHNLFPARTLESNKGQRKKGEYKQLMLCLTQEAALAGDVTDTGEKEEVPQPTGNAQSIDGESEILEHLRKLIQKLCPRKLQSDILRDIAKQACEGEDVSSDRNDYLWNIFVCTKGSVHGRARDRQAKGPTSHRKRKRREFARMQELFQKKLHHLPEGNHGVMRSIGVVLTLACANPLTDGTVASITLHRKNGVKWSQRR
ncbi:hypothetical protein HPB47_005513 [Ixodes persulcatus]|uniref:Uncharacterized protein n=1 Tax=Ixodes persulcatus TaxID=34615 RepID=A0AC60PCR7_IXOPE|nr:hypothetical protein HPB47_005513 [Ixodes persulcatus]